MDCKDVVYMQNGMLCSCEERWNHAICWNVVGTGRYSIERTKPDEERQTGWFTYLWNIEYWVRKWRGRSLGYPWPRYLERRTEKVRNQESGEKKRTGNSEWTGIRTWVLRTRSPRASGGAITTEHKLNKAENIRSKLQPLKRCRVLVTSWQVGMGWGLWWAGNIGTLVERSWHWRWVWCGKYYMTKTQLSITLWITVLNNFCFLIEPVWDAQLQSCSWLGSSHITPTPVLH